MQNENSVLVFGGYLPFYLLDRVDSFIPVGKYDTLYKSFKKVLILLCFGLKYENVIRFPDQNTLSTRVKQIRNPQKEISGGFLIFL